ncbi:MAG: hypothetical protein IPL61_17585 [Myxococcales bacterium]|nr:hypothetical protein [Myxococcales bacterium]
MDRWCAVLVAVATACTSTPGDDGPAVCSREDTVRFAAWRPHPVDVLVVVDRSASMSDDQEQLARFAGALASVATIYDAHVAVVTSDLGGDGVTGCAGDGDAARFQRATMCGVDGAFVRTNARADDGMLDNAGGDVRAALACMLELPTSSCPVSQPLAAALRALDGSQPADAGFHRPGVPLALMILTDSDDCSMVALGALRATGLPLGDEAEVDLACFTAGQGADGGLADPIATFAEVVGADRFWIGIVSGGPDVRVVDGALASACADGRSVVGAPRLAQLSAPERLARVDACGDGWSDLLSLVAWAEPGWAFAACLDPAADQAPTVPGAQVVCTAEQRITPVDRGDDVVAPLPPCGAGDDGPCWRIAGIDTATCPGGIEVRSEGVRGIDRVDVTLRCELPCD